MFKGFYNLASGMLTQSRVLNTVANNIANTSTPGYKKDIMANSTFRDELVYRTGNTQKTYTPIGGESMIRTVTELVTDFSQGHLEETERPLDFCIMGEGFFRVQMPSGETVYTRNGSFTLDNEGYLSLQHIGRVLGENGPIYLGTDRIHTREDGRIVDENGDFLGRLTVVDFADYTQLIKFGEGMFRADGLVELAFPQNTMILDRTLEASNMSASDEMVNMMTGQRALQSSAQMLRMYDQLMAKAVSEIGRV